MSAQDGMDAGAAAAAGDPGPPGDADPSGSVESVAGSHAQGDMNGAAAGAGRGEAVNGTVAADGTGAVEGLNASFAVLLCGGLGHAASVSGANGAARSDVNLEEAEDSDGWLRVGMDSSVAPPFHLRVSDGKYVGSMFCIPPLDTFPTVGRSRRNPICLLADDQVSRFHAYLTATSDGRVLLKDGSRESREASSNGTFVNSNCTRIDASG
ncbi:hypothetical protein T484DRAFT_1858241 [Baffinella frigidus]|nr:hypothetical protein T484DRAFT_1858241 [Cryptophyta sp. CCMP2293]